MASAVDYSKYRFLVVDDQPMVRQSLRASIQTMGGFAVDLANSYLDAIRRIRAVTPEILLVDYMLGDGRSGQQLLEEIRRFNLLPDEAIFIMVTAEQSYEQVVSAVELVPDDYILKPFSPELLHVRLDRLIRKKMMLYPFFVARRENRIDDARNFVTHNLANREFAHYRIDLMRCRAELDLSTNDYVAAEPAYQRILDIHDFPWAKIGLARALIGQEKFDQARALIDSVVEKSPMFFAAFDLKAALCSRMGEHSEAHDILEQTAARSPRNFLRKRHVAAAARASGNTLRAQQLMEEIIANDSTPGAVQVTDHLELARSAFDAGDLRTAERAVRHAATFDAMDFDDRLAFTALLALILPDEGRSGFHGLRETWLTTPLSPPGFLDPIRAALAINDPELADEITLRLLSHPGSKAAFKQAREIYVSQRREPQFREIQKRAVLKRVAGN
jgi:DNA-binding response OmpR family regulator